MTFINIATVTGLKNNIPIQAISNKWEIAVLPCPTPPPCNQLYVVKGYLNCYGAYCNCNWKLCLYEKGNTQPVICLCGHNDSHFTMFAHSNKNYILTVKCNRYCNIEILKTDIENLTIKYIK